MVPNVPCGVESKAGSDSTTSGLRFLMYRVELKVFSNCLLKFFKIVFLMYRVELKVNLLPLTAGKLPEQVPNVPCGVERIII